MDWLAGLVVLLFAWRGIRDGTVRQIFSVLGWCGGIWSLIVVSQWVGAHWLGARPAVVFGALRWLVALLAALAVVALFHLCGEKLGQAVQKSKVVWLDRLGGLVLGTAMGVCFVTAAVVAMLIMPWPRDAARSAAAARVTTPVLFAARWVLLDNERWVPVGDGVRKVLTDASHRARILSRQS